MNPYKPSIPSDAQPLSISKYFPHRVNGNDVFESIKYAFTEFFRSKTAQYFTISNHSNKHKDQAILLFDKINRNNGFKGIEPIAEVFGKEALFELVNRLRWQLYHFDFEQPYVIPGLPIRSMPFFLDYDPTRHRHRYRNAIGYFNHINFTGINRVLRNLARINSTTDNLSIQLQRTLGSNTPIIKSFYELLTPRLLLTIPGHFRDIARSTKSNLEAYLLECLGWNLMYYLRDKVTLKTNIEWWLPPKPWFVKDFPNPISNNSLFQGFKQIKDLVSVLELYSRVDPFLISSLYNDILTNSRKWLENLPGKLYLIETGQLNIMQTPQFDAEEKLFEKPNISINDINRSRETLMGIWRNNRNKIDRNRICHNELLIGKGELSEVHYQGIKMAYNFPCTQHYADTSKNIRESGTYNNTIHILITRLFANFNLLGWNDLIFNTGGALCFRGIGGGVNLSNHGLGLAIDINAGENRRFQGSISAIDPKVESVFKLFGFSFGGDYVDAQQDPMHFEIREISLETDIIRSPVWIKSGSYPPSI